MLSAHGLITSKRWVSMQKRVLTLEENHSWAQMGFKNRGLSLSGAGKMLPALTGLSNRCHGGQVLWHQKPWQAFEGGQYCPHCHGVNLPVIVHCTPGLLFHRSAGEGGTLAYLSLELRGKSCRAQWGVVCDSFLSQFWRKRGSPDFSERLPPELNGMPSKLWASIAVTLSVTGHLQLTLWTSVSSPARPTLGITILSEMSTVWSLSFPSGIPASDPSAGPSFSYNQFWLHSSNS